MYCSVNQNAYFYLCFILFSSSFARTCLVNEYGITCVCKDGYIGERCDRYLIFTLHFTTFFLHLQAVYTTHSIQG